MEPNFFFAQHTVQLEEATDFDVIVVDAKLVDSASKSGGIVEPVAPLECMAHSTSAHGHLELKFVPPIVQLELIPHHD